MPVRGAKSGAKARQQFAAAAAKAKASNLEDFGFVVNVSVVALIGAALVYHLFPLASSSSSSSPLAPEQQQQVRR